MSNACSMEGLEVLGATWALAILGLVLTVAVGVAVLLVYLWWRVFTKAGYPGPLALLTLVPMGRIVMLAILAFTDWPALKEGGRTRVPHGSADS